MNRLWLFIPLLLADISPSPTPVIKLRSAVDSQILFVTTLAGELHALDLDTNEIIWTQLNHHPLHIQGQPYTDEELSSQLSIPPGDVIPCPENGDIFVLQNADIQPDVEYALKKTPYTVQKLIERCPMRTPTDIYQGQKRDTWIEIDALTGKELLRTRDEAQAPLTCNDDDSAFSEFQTEDSYLDETNQIEYKHGQEIAVYNSRGSRKSIITLIKTDYVFTKRFRDLNNRDRASGQVDWNITYSDFLIYEKIPENYAFQHYITDDTLITVNNDTGQSSRKTFASSIAKIFYWSSRFGTMVNVPEERLAASSLSFNRKGFEISFDENGDKLVNDQLVKDTIKIDKLNRDSGLFATKVQVGPNINARPAIEYKTEDVDTDEGIVTTDVAIPYQKMAIFRALGLYDSPGESCSCSQNGDCYTNAYDKCTPSEDAIGYATDEKN